MRNICLLVSYVGTEFYGWQYQPALPTVQGAIEQAIFKMTGEKLSILSAGRTDAGVHALGQVVNFKTQARIPLKSIRPALQTHLPHTIVIREVCEVPDEFHATYSAIKKQYRYLYWNHPVTHPFLREFSWCIQRELDVEAMHAGANLLLGRHDFRSFETEYPNKASSVRTVMNIKVQATSQHAMWSSPIPFPTQHDEGAGRLIMLEIEADGFLYNMVRAIAGTLFMVGMHRMEIGEVQRILAAQDRWLAGQTAPPQGLFLQRVTYPGELFSV